MPRAGQKTWVVKEFGSSETFEVKGTQMVKDPDNTNRVTIYDGDDEVAQMNSVESIRPK